MTPIRYSQKELQALISGNNSFFLYHWTDITRLKEILSDGFLYSKGSLWGLGKNPIRRRTVISDTTNGFVDYIFLGKSNWFHNGMSSFYGQVGIEFNFKVLEEKEFFVFDANTGFNFNSLQNFQKFSDLTTLHSTINSPCRSSEYIVRRRIEVRNGLINAIYVKPSDLDTLRGIMDQTDLGRSLMDTVKPLAPTFIRTGREIEIKHPIFTDNTTKRFDQNFFTIEGEYCYIADGDSPCILTLKIFGNELKDFDDTVVGRFVN